MKQMPAYAKFMKDILSRRRKLRDVDETIRLTEECSAIIQRKLPIKRKDPGSFTIPVDIEGLSVAEALCDLGASINLMPLSMFRRLNLGEVTPTMISLQMADTTIKAPYGICEVVLVRVDKFVFPVDFVILDMEEDERVPLILGRPFLATGRDLIDMELGIMDLRVADDFVRFSVFKNMKRPRDEDVFRVEVVDELVCEEFIRISNKDTLEAVIIGGGELDDVEDEEVMDMVHQLESVRSLSSQQRWKEELTRDTDVSDKSEKVELKALPSTLKYAYLDEGHEKPVILSSSLSPLEE